MISSPGTDFPAYPSTRVLVGDLDKDGVEGEMTVDNVSVRWGTVIRILWLRFQLFAALVFVRF
jgi:hypothetical protein